MSQKYVALINDKIAFFDDEVSPPTEGCEYFPITDEEWIEAIANQGYRLVEGKLVPPEVKEIDIVSLQLKKKEEVDEAHTSELCKGFNSKVNGELRHYDIGDVAGNDYELLTAASILDPTSITINLRCSVNGVPALVKHSKKQLVGILNDLISFKSTLQFKHIKLYNDILKAKTQEDLDKISW